MLAVKERSTQTYYKLEGWGKCSNSVERSVDIHTNEGMERD